MRHRSGRRRARRRRRDPFFKNVRLFFVAAEFLARRRLARRLRRADVAPGDLHANLRRWRARYALEHARPGRVPPHRRERRVAETQRAPVDAAVDLVEHARRVFFGARARVCGDALRVRDVRYGAVRGTHVEAVRERVHARQRDAEHLHGATHVQVRDVARVPVKHELAVGSRALFQTMAPRRRRLLRVLARRAVGGDRGVSTRVRSSATRVRSRTRGFAVERRREGVADRRGAAARAAAVKRESLALARVRSRRSLGRQTVGLARARGVGGRVPRAPVAGRVTTGTARERIVPPSVPLAVAIRGLGERGGRVRVRRSVRVPPRLPHHVYAIHALKTRENLLGTPGEVRRQRSPARRVRSTRAVPPPRDTRVRTRGGIRAEPAA